MDKNVKGLLIGMILGDGYLMKRESGSVALMLQQCEKQTEFLKYKKRRLEESLGIKCTTTTGFTKLNGKDFPWIRLKKSHRYFRILRKWLYPNDKKTLQRKYLNYLTPEAIAIWYMDDGTLLRQFRPGQEKPHNCVLRLSLCAPIEETDIVINYFKEVWGVQFKYWRHTKKSYVSIQCSTKEARKFINIVKDYIIPEMFYKINVPAPRNSNISLNNEMMMCSDLTQ